MLKYNEKQISFNYLSPATQNAIIFLCPSGMCGGEKSRENCTVKN